jgi:hypothetical protein
MNASYYAEQSAKLYQASDEWRTKDPKDKFSNAKETAATYARLAAKGLREISQAMAEEERVAKTEAKQP